MEDPWPRVKPDSDPERFSPLPGVMRRNDEEIRRNGGHVVMLYDGPEGPDAVDVASLPSGMEQEIVTRISEEREAYFAEFPEMRRYFE